MLLPSLLLEKKISIEKDNYNPENLFKIYLLVNDEIANREKIFFSKYFSRNRTEESEIRLHLYLGLNQHIINQELSNRKLWVEALKFIQYEKWIVNDVNIEQTLNKYLNRFNVNSLYELFTIIFEIGKVALQHHKFKVENQDKKYCYLDYISNQKISTDEWNELAELIKNPLFKMKNGDFLIIDFYFILNKFYTGIYHDFLQFTNSNYVNFHQIYNTEFVEKYLLKNAIKSVFGNNYLQFSELKIKSYKTKNIENLALPDYYIRNGNKVFIFECKNSLLSFNSKLDLKFEGVENDFKIKYYKNGNKNKAAKQLLNFINLSNDNKYSFFDKSSKIKNLVHYPIIITTDDTLTSLSFNCLLNEFIQDDLKLMDKKLMNRIKPITIIHINDLLYRTTYLKKLDVLIDSYYRYYDTNNNVDKYLSFSDFIEIHVFKRNKSIDYKSLKGIMENSVFANK